MNAVPKFNSRAYLSCVLQSYGLKHIRPVEALLQAMQVKVQEIINKSFKGKLAGPISYSGSYRKNTDINIKWDMDILVPFKHSAYPRTEDLKRMRSDLFSVLKKNFEGDRDVNPRLQKVSVGLVIRKATQEEEELRLDIVPGREEASEKYDMEEKDITRTGLKLWNSRTHKEIKTNILKQENAVKRQKNAKELIRLLKVWKLAGNGPKNLSSIVIEALVCKALSEVNPKEMESMDVLDSLLRVTKWISENFATQSLRDIGNSNNILSDLYTLKARQDIANCFKNMHQKLVNNPESMRKYFPPNTNFMNC